MIERIKREYGSDSGFYNIIMIISLILIGFFLITYIRFDTYNPEKHTCVRWCSFTDKLNLTETCTNKFWTDSLDRYSKADVFMYYDKDQKAVCEYEYCCRWKRKWV